VDERPDSGAPQRAHPTIVGVAGRSGSGKTTLIEALIPALAGLGVRVATVKRTPRFDIDERGKDSWRHGRAGATTYVVASATQLAFVETTEAAGQPEAPSDDAVRRAAREPRLSDIVARFFTDIDLVLCESYRREAPRVIEVFRLAAGYDEPVCAPGEALALVTDAPFEHEHRFALDDAAGLAGFLVARLGLAAPE
jgi:molybdopterin-guanine dinucleotide biosynthesis adapter protein